MIMLALGPRRGRRYNAFGGMRVERARRVTKLIVPTYEDQSTMGSVLSCFTRDSVRLVTLSELEIASNDGKWRWQWSWEL